jgi:indolepyruvate ferredoxin oxidoreductase beta subunit
MEYNIILVGTGGQGTVLAGKLLSTPAIKKGLFARTSETIGMAQRGGSVTSSVRISDNDDGVPSPLLGSKTADMLIAMELSETVRILHLLKDDGVIVTCNNAVFPTTGNYEPEEFLAYLKKAAPNALVADVSQFIEENGAKALNVFMLALAAETGKLPFTADELEESVRENIPAKFLEINLTAFNAGRKSHGKLKS